MTFRFPPLIRRSPSGLAYLLYWLLYVLVYQLANRWHVVQPRELPFTPLDELIPFVPGLLPLYVTYFLIYWCTVCRSRNDDEVNRIFIATHFQLLLSLPFFVLMPIRMPVERFYPSVPLGWADALWRWFDAPANCFPSLHVANGLLLLHFNWTRPHRWLWGLVCGGVVVSTVLVKQHYVVDAVGGAAVYLASRWFLDRLEITGLDAAGWTRRTGNTSRAAPASERRPVSADATAAKLP